MANKKRKERDATVSEHEVCAQDPEVVVQTGEGQCPAHWPEKLSSPKSASRQAPAVGGWEGGGGAYSLQSSNPLRLAQCMHGCLSRHKPCLLLLCIAALRIYLSKEAHDVGEE